MSKSMTGYGSETISRDGWSISWEIKSVNSRFLDLKWRIPPALYFLQGKWEKIIRENASRGRVDINLNLQILDPDILGISLDRTMAMAMIKQLEELAGDMSRDFEPDLNMLIRNTSLWRENKGGISDELEKDLADCLKAALDSWNKTRQSEGALLIKDILDRIKSLEIMAKELGELAKDNAPSRFKDLRLKLERIMEEMAVEIDENRLLQELIIMADRLDVSEEMTRLEAHLGAMEDLLAIPGQIGRKLDFILQETFREINTCANKCQNTDMIRITVGFKAELEKCREQAQNLE
ncbi:YicC/YloC family endoribonuclease [Desulfonatronovibrio hydrogenovorans]|uniref:YicC/YloC family endoribonuclease n=1 Tax=Desulfonatronovibrio hydrogenovorans TaxID=53245 RepID=UPI000490A1BD|nr:YicC/YloC family endoribonuclease [Desulfonatronovibrio hydrogenovorans]